MCLNLRGAMPPPQETANQFQTAALFDAPSGATDGEARRISQMQSRLSPPSLDFLSGTDYDNLIAAAPCRSKADRKHARVAGMKTDLPQKLYLAAWIITGIVAGPVAAFVPMIFGASKAWFGFGFGLGALVGWGIGKSLLMLIRRASLDPQRRLVDRRGRVICENPGHPLAFSLRTLLLVTALFAIAAVLARKLKQGGNLDPAMFVATPLLPLAGGFFWLYSKQRGARSGLLIFLCTVGITIVWLICAATIPHRAGPESGMGVF